MPYQFQYQINNTNHIFRCDIATVRCQANKISGDRSRCSRLCAIGTPFCHSHLLSEHSLRIKEATNPNLGKGLFAQVSRSVTDHSIVFNNRETIIDYTGETINVATLNTRYDDLNANVQYTAPYAYEIIKDNSFVDAACDRGVASLVNHKPFSRANAKFVKIRNAQNVFVGVRLVATKAIRNNREIFASYGTGYSLHEPTTHRTTKRRN